MPVHRFNISYDAQIFYAEPKSVGPEGSKKYTHTETYDAPNKELLWAKMREVFPGGKLRRRRGQWIIHVSDSNNTDE